MFPFDDVIMDMKSLLHYIRTYIDDKTYTKQATYCGLFSQMYEAM